MYYMNEVIDNEYNRLSKILEYIENSEEDYSYLINRCRDIFEEKKMKNEKKIEKLKKKLYVVHLVWCVHVNVVRKLTLNCTGERQTDMLYYIVVGMYNFT